MRLLSFKVCPSNGRQTYGLFCEDTVTVNKKEINTQKNIR